MTKQINFGDHPLRPSFDSHPRRRGRPRLVGADSTWQACQSRLKCGTFLDFYLPEQSMIDGAVAAERKT